MHPLLDSIRTRPLDYLPEVSLRAFQHFIGGYHFRYAMEGRSIDWQYDHKKFHEWLRARYRMEGAQSIADTTIVRSFSVSEDDAFEKFFALLDEYQNESEPGEQITGVPKEKMNFTQLLASIRKRPAIYVWYETFTGCCAFMMGDELAYREIGLPHEEGREVFHSFQQWVVQEHNKAAEWRPWFRIIEFRSFGIDCGYSTRGAWNIFWKWLDQYTESIGKGHLFR